MSERTRRIRVFFITFFVPCLLLCLAELHVTGGFGKQLSDAKLYLSIADNFVSTGHFIQTDRPYTDLVVPPGVPAVLTLLRLLRLPVGAVIALQFLLFGFSNLLLYATLERLTGQGIWAPMIYTLAYARCWLFPGIVFVEHYALFLLCLAVWILFHDRMPVKKKLLLLNAIGVALLLMRPVLGVVWGAVLVFSLLWCIRNRKPALALLFVAVPLLLLGCNMAVNYRETGEIILLENYSGGDLYTAARPGSPVTLDEAAGFMDETYLAIKRGEGSHTEKNAKLRALAETYIRENPGRYLKNGLLRFYNLFLKEYVFATLYVLLGAILLNRTWQDRRRRRVLWLATGLTLLLALLSSFGVPEMRYTMVIWPLGAVHGSYLTALLFRKLFRKK